MKKALAFDIGGTKIYSTVVDEAGKIITEIEKFSTPKTIGEIKEILTSQISKHENDVDITPENDENNETVISEETIAEETEVPEIIEEPVSEVEEEPVTFVPEIIADSSEESDENEDEDDTIVEENVISDDNDEEDDLFSFIDEIELDGLSDSISSDIDDLLPELSIDNEEEDDFEGFKVDLDAIEDIDYNAKSDDDDDISSLFDSMFED